MANVLREVDTNVKAVCECEELIEEDIPGARLLKVPEKCKVTELRVWLQCRGQRVKSKETKAELCLRVYKCLDLGDQYTFVDPYPGQPHLERKRQQCTRCRVPPAQITIVQETDPVLKWTTDATVLPSKFTYLSILEYAKGSGKSIKGHVEKSFNRGYSLFFDGYIHEVQTADLKECVWVKSRCYRSMKKHETPHSLQVSVDRSGLVLKGKCSCVAGTGGYCNHVFGLLYQVDHSVRLGTKEFGRKLTCTDKPAEWTKSRTDGVRSEPIMTTSVCKPRYGSSSTGIKSSLYDARAENAQSPLELTDCIQKLSQINPLIGMCQTVNGTSVNSKPTRMGFNVPEGSMLSYQLALTEGNFSVMSNLDNEPDIKICPGNCVKPDFPWQSHQVPNLVDHELIKELKIEINKEKVNILEKETRDQSGCSLWFDERAKRLTASKFAHIVKRKKDKQSFVYDTLLSKKDLGRVPAIKYGREHEAGAIRTYSEYMNNSGRKVHSFKCGLVVNPNFPWLAASPDSIVHEEGVGFGLLEVKCPFSKRNITPEDACRDPNFCCEIENGKFQLKTEHEYYAQVQGQMGVCGASFCDFVVFSEKGLGIQRILFNNLYWSDLVNKLGFFFNESFAPVLLTK